MKVTKENLEGSKVRLFIEAPPSRVEEGLAKAYKDLNRRVLIDGFRKGRAPRHLVERFYKESLYEEAMKDVLPAEYLEAVEETGIEPISEPQYTEVEFKKGEPLTFTATVYVKPEVKLGDYRAISTPYEEPQVSEEEAEEEFRSIKERMAEIRPLPDDVSLKEGDYATCHVTGIEGGDIKIEIDTDLTYIEVGTDFAIVPGLGVALKGMKNGETKEFSGLFPKNIPAKEAETAGEDKEAKVSDESSEKAPEAETDSALFSLRVIKGYEKKLPSDEEMAKNLGRETVEEAKEDLKKSFLQMRVNESLKKHSEEVEKALLDLAEVEVPDILVEKKTGDLFQDFLERLQKAGADLDKYLSTTGKSLEDLQKEIRAEAEIGVKKELVLDEITFREKTQVPETVMNQVLIPLAGQMNQDIETLKTTLKVRGVYKSLENDIARTESLKKVAVLAAANANTPLPSDKKEDEDVIGEKAQDLLPKAPSEAENAEEPGGETEGLK